VNWEPGLPTQLAKHTYFINHYIDELEKLNTRFEDYFDKARLHREKDNINEANRYIELARKEKSKITTIYEAVDLNIKQRDSLVTYAISQTNCSSIKRHCGITEHRLLMFSISKTYVTNSVWNV